MKLKCLGSSSKGNSYLLIGKDETLIIEAGVNFNKVKEALNFDLSNVVGCIGSHEHLDHMRYANEMQSAGIEIVGTKGTLHQSLSIYPFNNILEYRKRLGIGRFAVTPFEIIHDAAEPCAFLIEHPEIGRLLFVTDTASFNYSFSNIDHFMIEANYEDSIVEKNAINNPNSFNNIERLEKSHMSLKECFLACHNNVSQETKNIVLIHLSHGNSDSEIFKNVIKRQTGKPTYVADEGFEIEL